MAKLPVNLSKARNAERVYSNAAKRYDGLARASKEAGNSAEARIYSKAASRMRFHEKSVSGAIKRGNIAEVQQTINASSQYTAKATSSKRARGEALGNALLEGTNAGHRFFAITKDIWQGSAYGDRWSALKEHFGDITPAEMIQKLQEETGIDILAGNINYDTDSLGGMSQAELLQAMEALMYG